MTRPIVRAVAGGLVVAALAIVAGVAALASAADTKPAETPKPAIERRIAITIDDLPWATLGDETPPTLAPYHAKLMAALKAEKVPVIGFVNMGSAAGSAARVDRQRLMPP